MEDIRFVASYSGGKDGALALYRAIKLGYRPEYLLTTYNKDMERSWFHGIEEELLEKVSQLIGIPLYLVETGLGDDYGKDFESALRELKGRGVNTCIFGDIDIEEHYDWCHDRCLNVGIESLFPLWNESRLELVKESINLGFKSIITVVDTSRMDEAYLARTLTLDLIEELEAKGIDPCGENGEYHSFTYDGPIFKEAIELELGQIVRKDKYSAQAIYLKS